MKPNVPREKKIDRKRIEADTAAFLAAGGKVKTVPGFERTEDRHDWSSEKRRAQARMKRGEA